MADTVFPVASLVALVALVAGCATSDDSDVGVPELSVTPLSTIGSAGGGGPDAFAQVTDFEIGEDGSVFVLDGPNGVVQVFGADGAHRLTMGGRGSGPGELERPEALFWGTADELWVVDPGNGRYSVFGVDGRPMATYRRLVDGTFRPFPGGLSADGLLYDLTFRFGPDGPSLFMVPHRVLDDDLALLEDSAGDPRLIELPALQTDVFELRSSNMALVVPVPFASQPVFQLGPDGSLWRAETRQPWVYRRSLTDGAEQRFGRDFAAPAVTPAALEKALDHEDYAELKSIADPSTLVDFTERVPDTLPHLLGFFLDDEGRVWVMRSDAPSDDSSTGVDVYGRDGALLAAGLLALEPDPRPRLRAGVLVGVQRDVLGVESIVRLRVGTFD